MSSTRPELKFSDNSDQSGFFRKYKSLLPAGENVLRIADRGDYYTILAGDAGLVAESIYKTKLVLKSHSGVEYVTLSAQVFSQLVTMFVIEQGYKIELYDRLWKLVKNVSPGNLQAVEDLVTVVDGGGVLGAVKVQDRNDGKYVGLAYVDGNLKEIGYSEFIDNELFSGLESALIQLNIKECLVPSVANLDSDASAKKLMQVINRCEVAITEVKGNFYATGSLDSDLEKLLSELSFKSVSTAEVQSKGLGLASISALVVYLGLLSEESSYGSYELRSWTPEKVMKLDLSAVKALNLFPSARDLGTKHGSVYGLLNCCKSAEGQRLLSRWIKQPLTDLDEITARHLLVGFLMDDSQLRKELQEEVLNRVPDIRRLTRKLAKGKASLEDAVRIYQLVLKLPELVAILEAGEAGVGSLDLSEGEKSRLQEILVGNWLGPLKQLLNALLKFQELVETTIDLDALDNREYVIKPEFNDDLLKIKQKSELLMELIKNCHFDAAEELGKDPEKKLKLENHHAHGWCMRLTRTDATVLRGHSNYIELQTVKAGVFFTTAEMRNVADSYNSLQSEYNKTQSGVVKEIMEITASYRPLLDTLSSKLAEIDVIVAFAHVSSHAPVSYIRPTMYGLGDAKRRSVVKQARHPCLEMQDEVSFIANDVELVKNESEFLVITGPNMGGKSTYIKTIGILSLMAQIGCFVPAESAELCVVDAVLARVGAGDSQLKGISTFMAEMLEIASILKAATENSLIIIDELGRGTSTYDGFGLAYSISQHIAKEKKCFTLFATHFHELTSLADQIPTVQNLHVVAHVTTDQASNDITLLYKVEPGISDQSFGIHVAEVVKFPRKIISMSKRKASELEEFGGKADGDPYVADKRTKCNSEEVGKGSELLKRVLKEWKSKVENEKLTNDQAVETLKGMFTEDVRSDKFLREVLTL